MRITDFFPKQATRADRKNVLRHLALEGYTSDHFDKTIATPAELIWLMALDTAGSCVTDEKALRLLGKLDKNVDKQQDLIDTIARKALEDADLD